MNNTAVDYKDAIHDVEGSIHNVFAAVSTALECLEKNELDRCHELLKLIDKNQHRIFGHCKELRSFLEN